jgi:predicted small secreted protein
MKMRVIIIAFIIIGAMFISGCNAPGSSGAGKLLKTADGKIICGDVSCLGQNFASCTPAEVTMSSEGQAITITIHGLENEKCHYTMVFGNVTPANCYFKKEDLTANVLGQTFGNKLGQDAIIAEACK